MERVNRTPSCAEESCDHVMCRSRGAGMVTVRLQGGVGVPVLWCKYTYCCIKL